jgi:hypothetical protein
MAELKARVNRDLRLEDPMIEGPDVEELQKCLNRAGRQFNQILHFAKLAEDGRFGEKTLLATLRVAHIMGFTRPRLNQIEREHLVVLHVQTLVRRPGSRTDAAKKRGRENRAELRKRLERRPSLKNVEVTLTAGSPHWGGSGDVLTQFVERFMVKRGLPLGSGKRTPAENAAIGGSTTSHHLTTNTTTAARDFPTFSGEDDARALAKAMGFGSWRPNSFAGFSFSAGGQSFSGQILWGSGIQHGDHVHVGITRA